MFFKNKKKLARGSAFKKDDQVRFRIVGRHRGGSRGKPASLASRIFYWLAFLAFAGGVFYILFLSPLPAVSEIGIQGVESYDPEAVRAEIEARISGRYLDAFPKNNIILLSKGAIEKDILGKFKMFEEVAVKKVFPDKLAIAIRERKTGSVLCSGGQCFVLDEHGHAFAAANFETNELKEDGLIRLFDDSNKAFKIGEAVLDPEYLKYLLEVTEKIQEQARVTLQKEVHTPQIASGDIRMRAEEGWQIYLDREIPAEKEAEALRLVLENKIPEGDRKNLDYVDLRAENKVYYKFKNAEQPQVQESGDADADPQKEEKKENKKKSKNT